MSVSERGAAGLLEDGTEPSAPVPQPQPTWLQRLAGPALFTAAAIVAFACYLRMSLTVPVNSDGASNALQAWDMLHGNPLLHGWWLSDVSFYTTALPALLAKGGAAGTQGWIRMLIAAGLMLAPQLGVGTQVLLLSPDHVGTVVPVLAA